MIRKETQGGWILFTQDDHANLAGRIMEYWGNDKFSGIRPRDEVLFAISNHDSGWKKWDSRPRIDKKTGYPANFLEMYSSEQHNIWLNSFLNGSPAHAYPSALIALHFSKFNDKLIERDPGDPEANDLKEKIIKFVSGALNIEFSSLGESELSAEIMTNLKFVQTGDLISLAVCHGWKSTELLGTPLNYEGDVTDMVIQSADGLNFRISPYPFSKKRLEFSIKGVMLTEKKFKTDADLLDAMKKGERQNFYFTIS